MAKVALARLGTKTRSGHAGQRMHDTRAQVPDYVVADRMHLNTEPVPVPSVSEMVEECETRRQARYERGELKRKPGPIRSDGVVTISGIIAFSTEAQEAIKALPVEEQDRLYLEAAESIAERLGTTVAGLVVHRDEWAPHAHFYLHGVGLDGKPVSKKLNRVALSEAQDLTAAAYSHLGIVRGKTRLAREADGEDPSTFIHKTLREMHGEIPGQIKEARARRDAAVQEAEAARAEAEEAKAEAAALREKLATTQKRLDRLRFAVIAPA